MSGDTTLLGEFISIQGGFAYKSSDFLSLGEYPILKIKNVRFGHISYDDTAFISADLAKSTEAWSTQEGDVLISLTGSGPNAPDSLVGRVARVWKNEPKAWINQRVGRVKLKNAGRLHPDFIFYLLSHKDSQDFLVNNSSGSANQANISGKTVESLPCPNISYEASEKIGNILRVLDEKIILNRQINQTLETMVQALFKSWFIDFEPVRAKIAALETGEDPTRAAMRAISGKTDAELGRLQTTDAYAQLETNASLFPSAFIESELGLVPEGWEVSEIGKEVEVVGGGTPSTTNLEFWDNGEINWTSPKDLSGLLDKVLLSTGSKITTAGLKKISSGLLPVNTVLMSSRAPVGYLALAKVPVAINQGYIAMKCTKVLSPEYAIQWAHSVMDEIKQRASGSTFAEISKASFRPIKVIVPTIEIIGAYTNQARSLYNLIAEKVIESNELALMRDTLLPMLLSGEIKLGTKSN